MYLCFMYLCSKRLMRVFVHNRILCFFSNITSRIFSADLITGGGGLSLRTSAICRATITILAMLNPSVTSLPSGLGDKIKRKKVLTWLKSKPEDIIFVQETHSTSNTEKDWKRHWGEYAF